MVNEKDKPIEWQAAEAIDYKRSSGWYVVLFLIAAAVIGICIWQKQWVTIVLVVVIVAAILVVQKQPTRVLKYSLTPDGVVINNKNHPFDEYRAFGVRHDGNFWSLVLIPVKRFGAETTIFIREEHGEQIVDFIGQYLPMEKVGDDVIGKITRKLKF
jgi:hypothetical protein